MWRTCAFTAKSISPGLFERAMWANNAHFGSNRDALHCYAPLYSVHVSMWPWIALAQGFSCNTHWFCLSLSFGLFTSFSDSHSNRRSSSKYSCGIMLGTLFFFLSLRSGSPPPGALSLTLGTQSNTQRVLDSEKKSAPLQKFREGSSTKFHS